MSQPTDETGDRQRYVVNGTGDIIAVESPVNDQAAIVLRSGNTEFDIIGFGDTAPGIPDCANPTGGTGDDGCDDPGVFGPVWGVGHPDMNDGSRLVSSIALTSQNIDRYTPWNSNLDLNSRNDSALVTGNTAGVTTIAQTLQTIDGQTICSIEPMPQINASGQAFFGATLESPNIGPGTGDPLCLENGRQFFEFTPDPVRGGVLRYAGAKGIYRHTPGGSTDLMLLASMDQSIADEVTTSDPRWVDSQTTFDIIDAHLIAHSHRTVTNGGAALAFAWMTDDTLVPESDVNTRGEFNGVEIRKGWLYLDGSSVQLVAMEEAEAAGIGRFAEVNKSVGNSSGRVVFKAEDYTDCCGDDLGIASMNIWTPGGGLQGATLAQTDDPVPGAAAGTVFNGFAPDHSTDDLGQVAFTAGLEISGICDAASAPDAQDFAEHCRGVYHADLSGTITEIARTTAAAQAAGAGASSWTDGSETFNFDAIGSVAILGPTPNTVLFVANHAFDVDGDGDPVDPLTLEPRGYERGNDHNSDAGVFAWRGGTIEKIVAEGDVIPLSDVGGPYALDSTPSMWERIAAVFGVESAHAQSGTATVIRLFTPMPQLRQHIGPNGFSIRAWIDTTGDGVEDTDSMLTVGTFREPLGGIPIPTMSTAAYSILGLMLMLVGLLVVRGGVFRS